MTDDAAYLELLAGFEQALEATKQSLTIARELAEAYRDSRHPHEPSPQPIWRASRATRTRCRRCARRWWRSKGGSRRTDMMATRTPEQQRAEYVEKMGDLLGAQFYRLMNYCHLLHVKWEYYVTLYGTREERVALLNKAAPAFFRVIEDALWDDVLLHITRLTENPVVNRRETLTIQRLPALVDEGIRGEVSTLLAAAREAATALRDWRNRRIAHRDLRLALGEAEPLAPASRALVTRSIEAIIEVLKAVEKHYCNVDPMYLNPVTFGTAEDLLYVIRDGVEAREQENERARAGRLRLEDLSRRTRGNLPQVIGEMFRLTRNMLPRSSEAQPRYPFGGSPPVTALTASSNRSSSTGFTR